MTDDQNRDNREPESLYTPLDKIPDTTKRLITIEVLEDLADSQLIGTVELGPIPPSQYISAIATLMQLTSNLSNKFATAQGLRQSELRSYVDEAFESAGMQSPFAGRTEIGDEDVEVTLTNLAEYLDNLDTD